MFFPHPAPTLFHTFPSVRWLFEDPINEGWIESTGTMKGNGFGWGQFSHTFAWLYRVTGLTPESVFAFTGKSDITGADIYDR